MYVQNAFFLVFKIYKNIIQPFEWTILEKHLWYFQKFTLMNKLNGVWFWQYLCYFSDIWNLQFFIPWEKKPKLHKNIYIEIRLRSLLIERNISYLLGVETIIINLSNLLKFTLLDQFPAKVFFPFPPPPVENTT